MESQFRPQDKVRINVSGTVFVCFKKTLKVFEDSRLAKLDQSADNFDHLTEEFFFDRDARMFSYILDAYRKGTVHLPQDTCGVNFRHELEFWGLSTRYVSPCCWKSLYGSEEDMKTVATLEDFYCRSTGAQLMTGENISARKRIWLFLYEPQSSIFATVWAVFISLVIVTSILNTAMESLPAVYTDTYSAGELKFLVKMYEILGWANNSQITDMFFKKLHPAVHTIDCVCFAVLTIETLMVVIVCPCRCELLKRWIHWAEIICTLCFWISFTIEMFMEHIESTVVIRLFLYLKYVAALKIVRLFRVGANIPALKVMGLSMKESRQDLAVMGLMLFILSAFFGLLIFLVEVSLSGTFENVFSAMYWAVITLTTVGYGDYTPSSPGGHVIASACAVCGVLMLALPIGIIASEFNNFYAHHKYAKKYCNENGYFNSTGKCCSKSEDVGKVRKATLFEYRKDL